MKNVIMMSTKPWQDKKYILQNLELRTDPKNKI